MLSIGLCSMSTIMETDACCGGGGSGGGGVCACAATAGEWRPNMRNVQPACPIPVDGGVNCVVAGNQ